MILFKPFPSSWLALPVLHFLGCDRADLEQPHGEKVWEGSSRKGTVSLRLPWRQSP